MRAARLLLWTAALGLSAPALAWSLVSWNWSWMDHPLVMPFQVNVASFAPIGGAAQVEAAFRDGMATWGLEGGSTFDFSWGGRTTATSWSPDRALITWFDPGSVSGGTLAISQSWGWADEMTDCDQRFYANNAFGPIRWSTNPAGAAPGDLDLQYTAIHEYGHCAGIDHSADASAIMYSSTAGGEQPADRHLQPDDVGALQAMYGVPSGTDLVLSVDGPVYAGASHEIVISGADPGERAWLIATTRGAGRTCPPALNQGAICLDLRGPVVVVGSEPTDAAGRARFRISLPANLWGTWVTLQAGVLRGANNADTILSNAESFFTLSQGFACPQGQTPDCDGTCWPSHWIGDNICNDGRVLPSGDADFDCATFHGDQGDCVP